MKPNLKSLDLEDTSGASVAGLTTTVVGHVLNCRTRHQFELIDLTQQVEELVAKTGIREGMALLQSLALLSTL